MESFTGTKADGASTGSVFFSGTRKCPARIFTGVAVRTAVSLVPMEPSCIGTSFRNEASTAEIFLSVRKYTSEPETKMPHRSKQ